MDLAYAAADVVISRAGALAVSELCVTGKACILVPSPNVAEDHQTKNAKALTDLQAAVLVTDKEASTKLVEEALRLLFDDQRMKKLQAKIAELAKPFATRDIVNEVETLIGASEKKISADNLKTLSVVMN
jgi:UDP-N-acetylglucosamine--N-acetylmuramyl-(pentapeptide) pyrophosphoryl-undecaprenol N-acetylglucosamine transferase